MRRAITESAVFSTRYQQPQFPERAIITRNPHKPGRQYVKPPDEGGGNDDADPLKYFDVTFFDCEEGEGKRFRIQGKLLREGEYTVPRDMEEINVNLVPCNQENPGT